MIIFLAFTFIFFTTIIYFLWNLCLLLGDVRLTQLTSTTRIFRITVSYCFLVIECRSLFRGILCNFFLFADNIKLMDFFLLGMFYCIFILYVKLRRSLNNCLFAVTRSLKIELGRSVGRSQHYFNMNFSFYLYIKSLFSILF